jgi:OmpA-OmpF porin, OOP family
MLKTFTKTLLALMVLFNATAAYSQWYFGVAGGTSSFDLPDEIDELNRLIDDVNTIPGVDASFDAEDSDTGMKLFAGNRLSDTLAIEFGYIDLGEISADFSLVDDGTSTGDPISAFVSERNSVSGFSFAAVGELPFSETASLIGRIGVYVWESEYEFSSEDSDFGSFSESGSDDGNDIFYGVGLNVGWLELFYDVYDIDGDGVNFIGLSARFESE